MSQMSREMSTNDLSPQQEEGADGVVAHVLRIPEILSKILCYMNFKDLNETRLVNHLWKSGSGIYFKQKSHIDLIFPRDLDKVGVKTFLKICKSHQNFVLTLFSPYQKEILKYENIEILNFVLSSPPPLIKCIRLELYVRDSKDFILKFNILSNLSHLKELELKVDVSECWEKLDIDKALQAVPQLPLVTKLGIRLYVGKDLKESDEPKFQKLCRELLFMTPNLEVLVPHVTCNLKDIDYIYLEQIVLLQKEWKESKSKKGPIPFQNLSFIYGLRLYKLSISEKVLKSCLEFMQPLKGLSMIGLRAENKLTLETILQKNSTTLETLEFADSPNVFNIIPPVLPRLGRLSLADGDVFNLRELFLMGSDKFNSTFPKLHFLLLNNPKNFLPLPNCLDSSFLQFTTLEVTFRGGKILVWNSDEDYGSGSGKEWAEWISKLFPNVHNFWINKARQNIQARI